MKARQDIMKMVKFYWLFSLLTVIATAKVNENLQGNKPGTDIQSVTQVKLIQTGPKGSKLYQFNSDHSIYDDAPYLLNLAPSLSSYDQGYDNGYLLGEKYIENYNSLMIALLGNSWWEPIVQGLLGKFLDAQWNKYLSKQLPQEYLDEIAGISAGGKAAGNKQDIGKIAGRGITLANFPSDLPNLKYIIEDEIKSSRNKHHQDEEDTIGMSETELKQLLEYLSNHWQGLSCSMFGVWGSRTSDGRLYTGRNLDWFKDTGISKYKLITIHRPSNGYAHATIGWVGIWGALTGISSQGITVHEANLESNDITFRGFPWILRLRHVMAYATTINEALSLWNSTNNTVGFNHGFGSAKDGKAVVLETMKGNTAVFEANDPREQDLVVDGQQIGLAREETVFRTNHGYDSYTIEHYMWNDTSYYNSSIERYKVFPQMFDGFVASNTKMTYVEAVSVT